MITFTSISVVLGILCAVEATTPSIASATSSSPSYTTYPPITPPTSTTSTTSSICTTTSAVVSTITLYPPCAKPPCTTTSYTTKSVYTCSATRAPVSSVTETPIKRDLLGRVNPSPSSSLCTNTSTYYSTVCPTASCTPITETITSTITSKIPCPSSHVHDNGISTLPNCSLHHHSLYVRNIRYASLMCITNGLYIEPLSHLADFFAVCQLRDCLPIDGATMQPPHLHYENHLDGPLLYISLDVDSHSIPRLHT
ncbi:hypothetical protein SISSUDRAFT_819271 [Sistotremastrum suecicum HHB10207 ss-3]|uniref:Uncharacterized protein n=1 Tax=Sistotremastrum suecicum HHB10207 ss-3 TaxID=1314776 RepID=A0A166CSM3_9AGAM|nr:hypothetical protein SISSUDRAFT_819271 [Sistotremastrum suecicum HHB10207 ss-3]